MLGDLHRDIEHLFLCPEPPDATAPFQQLISQTVFFLLTSFPELHELYPTFFPQTQGENKNPPTGSSRAKSDLATLRVQVVVGGP